MSLLTRATARSASRTVVSRRTGPRIPMAGRQSPLGGHAAASIDGQTAPRTIVTSFRNPRKCRRFGIRHAHAARGLAAEHLDLGTEVGVGHVGQQPRVDVGVGGNRRERLIEIPPMSSGSASDSLTAPTPAVIQSPERYARHRLRPTRFWRAAAAPSLSPFRSFLPPRRYAKKLCVLGHVLDRTRSHKPAAKLSYAFATMFLHRMTSLCAPTGVVSALALGRIQPATTKRGGGIWNAEEAVR